MIIKKFQGKTEAAAAASAKKELGNSVVIMNVKNVKRRGLAGFFGASSVEVTAALEENDQYTETGRTVKDNGEQPIQPKPIQFPESRVNTEKHPANTEHILRENKEAEQEEVSGKFIEEKLNNLQFLLERKLNVPEEEKEKDAGEEKEDSEMVVFMQLLYNTMIENEVDEKYANQIIDEVSRSSKPNMPMDYILSNVYQRMVLKFGKPEPLTPAKKGVKVIFFIGPTGVGKTTTIAKIASKFKVEEKKTIAMLTADTYRIAAAEQLRTYANILDAPFRVIYSAEEVQTAVKDFQSYEYIFIDTAGHSHQNEAQRSSTEELLRSLSCEVEKEVFMVVSATTKYKDLVKIADSYSNMTHYKIIFTKLDETETCGNILNLKIHTGESLSYVTYGQNVPDDIDKFSPQNTVKLLLSGKH